MIKQKALHTAGLFVAQKAVQTPPQNCREYQL
jgi:hypothetical protein